MKLAIRNLLKSSLLLGLVSVGVYACGQSNGSGNGTGGSSSGGAGGTGAGGHTASGGTTSAGGSTTSGGTKGSGGAQETGGTVGAGGSGGNKATGGTSSGGAATGGSSSGGAGAGGSSSSASTGGAGGLLSGGTGGMVTGTGGMVTGTGGMALGAGGMAKGDAGVGGKGGTVGPTDGGLAGGGAGGTSSGACQKGQIKPSEVVFMGESFYAIDPQYNEKRVESDAQAAGALAAGAKYRNVAVSGQTMNYVATTEWPAATQGGTVKVVIMDGGGIDAMSSSCSSCTGDFTTLLGKMATEGVQDVIYTRYPEPGNPPGSNTTLKANLDILMPKMQTVCEGTTSPKCHWVDLRPVWVNGDTTDGLHPTQSGGNHVGDAIWAEMVKDCIAQ
jgi:hypothetical protein